MNKQIKYTVKTGDLEAEVWAGENITPMEIAMLALFKLEEPTSLGLLLEVSGGAYVKSQVTYVSTEVICDKLGIGVTPKCPNSRESQ
jgi:hypothetical protein